MPLNAKMSAVIFLYLKDGTPTQSKFTFCARMVEAISETRRRYSVHQSSLPNSTVNPLTVISCLSFEPILKTTVFGLNSVIHSTDFTGQL